MKDVPVLKFLSCLLSIVILSTTVLSGCASSNNNTEEAKICEYVSAGQDITEQVKDLLEDKTLLESNGYRFVIEPSGVLKVVDIQGRIFWSSGVSSLSDVTGDESLASTTVKYKVNNVSKERDSYGDAYLKNQFRLYRKDNTIVYEQIIGDFVEDLLIPEALSEEKFSEITSKMGTREASYISRQYNFYTPDDATKDILQIVPDLKNNSYYVLMENNSSTHKKRIHEAFLSAGFTKNDLEEDRSAAGINAENQSEVFKIVMNFTLDGDDLVVEIPCDQIYYPEGIPIESLNIFKYGQFANSGSKGSYIVPSGSGAQFDFADNKSVNYQLQFYGKDYSYDTYSSDSDYSSHPFFGMVYEDIGCVGIIEEGAEILSLNIENAPNGFIQYPKLLLTPSQISKVGQSFTLYASDSYAGNVKIRYSFFTGEDANYSKFAEYYGKYLSKIGAFDNKTVGEKLPFETEIVNSIYVKDSIAGISYTTEKVISSFDETKEMISWFNENGIDNIWVKLSGANKRGLFAQTPGKFKLSNKAGGEKDYFNLIDYCNSINAKMFLNVNMPFYYADSGNDGYRADNDTARALNQKQVQINVHEKSTLEKRTDIPKIEVVSSSKYNKFAEEYNEQSKTLGWGISLGEMTRILNSDFSDDGYVSRTKTKENTEKSLQILQNSYAILAEDSAAYAMQYIYGLEKIDLGEDSYKFFERNIPLIPIAIHGKIQYTSTYWNDQPNVQKARLKAIEYGTGVAYRFAKSVDKESVGDQNSFLYNVDYSLRRDTALSNYDYISTALKGLNNVAMKNHTYITDTLIKVEYENGTIIYLNYSNDAVNVDGSQIEGMSYLRIG